MTDKEIINKQTQRIELLTKKVKQLLAYIHENEGKVEEGPDSTMEFGPSFTPELGEMVEFNTQMINTLILSDISTGALKVILDFCMKVGNDFNKWYPLDGEYKLNKLKTYRGTIMNSIQKLVDKGVFLMRHYEDGRMMIKLNPNFDQWDLKYNNQVHSE